MKIRLRHDDDGADDFFVMLDPGPYADLAVGLEKRLGIQCVSAKTWYAANASWQRESKVGVVFDNMAAARVNLPRELLEKEFGKENVAANFELQAPDITIGSTPLSGSNSCNFDQHAESWSRQIVDPPPRNALDGSGIKVCVIDTGITALHPDFVNRPQDLGHMKSFVPPDPSDIEDFKGHGTHCAGIICGKKTPGMKPRYGIAPGIELFVANVFGRATIAKVDRLIAALDWAVDQKCNIVSMSLYSTLEVHQDPQGLTDADTFKHSLQRALDPEHNTILIACTGNTSNRKARPADGARFPASIPGVLAVGGIDCSKQIMNESNSGALVVGPGQDVWSAFHDANAFTFMSGTSMATANVAGIAALHAQSSAALRGTALRDHVIATAKNLGLSPADMGSGLAQVP